MSHREERRKLLEKWSRTLSTLLTEMEEFNGPGQIAQADDKLEARVRIAWEQAYAELHEEADQCPE